MLPESASFCTWVIWMALFQMDAGVSLKRFSSHLDSHSDLHWGAKTRIEIDSGKPDKKALRRIRWNFKTARIQPSLRVEAEQLNGAEIERFLFLAMFQPYRPHARI